LSAQRMVNFELRTFKPGELKSAIVEAFAAIGLGAETLVVRQGDRLPDGTEHDREMTLDDLWTVCDIDRSLSITPGRAIRPHLFFLNLRGEALTVSVQARTPEQLAKLLETLETKLALVPKEVSPASSRLLAPPASPASTSKLVPPEKVTLKWLAEHVPAPLWLWAAGIALAIFVAGAIFGQTTLARELLRGLGRWDGNATAPTTPTVVEPAPRNRWE